MRSLIALVALALVLLVPSVASSYEPPPIQGHVTDQAGKLTRSQRDAVEKKLEAYRLCSKYEIRIETGKGVSGQLTDIESSHIIRDEIAPRLKVDAYFSAIDAGTTAIVNALGSCAIRSPETAAAAKLELDTVFHLEDGGLCLTCRGRTRSEMTQPRLVSNG